MQLPQLLQRESLKGRDLSDAWVRCDRGDVRNRHDSTSSSKGRCRAGRRILQSQTV